MTDKHQCANNRLLKFFQLIKGEAIDNVLKMESKTQYYDWRLPTIQELLTLVNYNKYNPACDLEDTQCNFYWSSSPFAPDSSYAWNVGFYDGGGYWEGKSRFHLVRCVRDGENGLEWSATSKLKMSWNEAIEYADNLVAPVYYKG